MNRMVLTLGGVAVFLSVACGGGGRDGTGKFVFTPAPYIYGDLGNGTQVPVSIVPGETPCFPYIADEVDTLVQADRLDAFKQWLSSVGFSVRREGSGAVPGLPRIVLVAVPLGSVPDALALIQAQHGVLSAARSSIGRYPESTPPAICRTRPKGAD